MNEGMRVCGKCQRFLKVKDVGIWVLEWGAVRPYKLWAADLFECPECGHEIIAGFGDGPVSHAWELGFADDLRRIRKSGKLIIEAFHGPYSKKEETKGEKR